MTEDLIELKARLASMEQTCSDCAMWRGKAQAHLDSVVKNGIHEEVKSLRGDVNEIRVEIAEKMGDLRVELGKTTVKLAGVAIVGTIVAGILIRVAAKWVPGL